LFSLCANLGSVFWDLTPCSLVEATDSSETSPHIYQTIWHHAPEDDNFLSSFATHINKMVLYV